jgi:hypothetical protein
MPLSSAERQRAYISRLKAAIPTAPKPRRPIDRRTKPQRWDDAVGELLSLLDDYQTARDNLPDSLAETAYVEKLDAILELRELVESLADADLPKGFGRD